jgi:hypothetical protein
MPRDILSTIHADECDHAQGISDEDGDEESTSGDTEIINWSDGSTSGDTEILEWSDEESEDVVSVVSWLFNWLLRKDQS